MTNKIMGNFKTGITFIGIIIVIVLIASLVSYTSSYGVHQNKNPTVTIDGILRKENAISEQWWIIQLKFCAGDNGLTTPEVRIKTDIDDTTIKTNKVISAGSCAYSDIYDVKAINPSSIDVSFTGVYSDISLNHNVKKIPEWVKNIFKFYVEGQISENDMIEALQFLIKEGIIKV